MNILKLSTLLLFAIGFQSMALAQNSNKMNTLTIATSAVCEMCVATIEEGFAFEKGVNSAHVDLTTNTVTVRYKTKKTDPETLRLALTDMGYAADSIPPDQAAYDKLHHCCKADLHNGND